MSNLFELLIGPTVAEIQKNYEMLSDIVIVEHVGKVHGSQRDKDPKTGLIDLLVYYEVPPYVNRFIPPFYYYSYKMLLLLI